LREVLVLFDHCKGIGPYSKSIRSIEEEIKKIAKKVNDITGKFVIIVALRQFQQFILGIKESDTGLAPPSQRDLIADKQMMSEEQPLQVLTLINTTSHSCANHTSRQLQFIYYPVFTQ
jgi:hypothetical protein